MMYSVLDSEGLVAIDRCDVDYFNKTVVCNDDGLSLDFRYFLGWTFKIGNNSNLKVGSHCIINAGNNNDIEHLFDCKINVGEGCKVIKRKCWDNYTYVNQKDLAERARSQKVYEISDLEVRDLGHYIDIILYLHHLSEDELEQLEYIDDLSSRKRDWGFTSFVLTDIEKRVSPTKTGIMFFKELDWASFEEIESHIRQL